MRFLKFHSNIRLVIPLHDDVVISYNCSEPPNPLEMLLVELDCHWLDETTLECCVIQVIRALWPLLPGPPPEPLSKKNRIEPL